MKHLTARMAWHDNKWNGRICRAPAKNVYCTAPYSLLSARLQRERKLDEETKEGCPGEHIDITHPGYTVPCFWSCNAFSSTQANVVHIHAFEQLRETHRIEDVVKPYSVFTWPFRLSFLHADDASKAYGKYPPDLDDRIRQFRVQFAPSRSLVFLYLNYDNPVSADDYKYALVGCARFSDIGEPKEYPFTKEHLAEIRSGDGMQNMPTMNWALPVSYDGAQAVLLPYHEYLEHIERHPEEEDKLEEMRVLIEENELVRSFKYVSEAVDHDRALFLLYKLRKAVQIAEGHGIVKSVGNARQILDQFIGDIWRERGQYPGLPAILALMAETGMGAGPQSDFVADAERACEQIRNCTNGTSELEEVFSLLKTSGTLPAHLSTAKKLLSQARKGFRATSNSEDLLRKLSLFSLSAFQMRRIVFPGSMKDEPSVWGSAKIAEDELVRNPYLLCERYTPVTVNEAWRDRELDIVERRESSIDPFMIDIGMFPDPDHAEADDELCDLAPTSPERLRALMIDYLHRIGEQGHCFATLDEVHDFVRGEPLFYQRLQQNNLAVNRNQLASPIHRQHYASRLHLTDHDGQTYIYLREVHHAEDLIKRYVLELCERPDHGVDLSWVDAHVKAEAAGLQKRPRFDEKVFLAERRQLTEGALSRSLFVISGKAGSGKTHAIKKVIAQLLAQGESVMVLAPTGKAALRAKQEAKFEDTQTIDRFIYSAKAGACMDDFEAILSPPHVDLPKPIQNVIVDESSMVNLEHLATLVHILQEQGQGALHRLILIGDENQLPPIGLGRPFYDIITYLQTDPALASRHLVHLNSDCRTASDIRISQAAEVFIGKNRYHAPILQELSKTNVLSNWLKVFYWADADELSALVDQELESLLKAGGKLAGDQTKFGALNLLYGLYAEGNVPSFDAKALKENAFQIITPYRAGGYGTIGLNEAVRRVYKAEHWPDEDFPNSVFGHSERIIRLSNWYVGRGENRRLRLSNGSVGFVCNGKRVNKFKRLRGYFFRDAEYKLSKVDDEEAFEPAYAITVHKAQGSEYENVFVVIPERRSLLTRELVYTALTRSSGPVTLFVQTPQGENPLEVARGRSAVQLRNTSLLSDPTDARLIHQPEPGIWVQSKIEYIIYSILREYREQNRLRFTYEKPPLTVPGIPVPIKPDFTIEVGGHTFYWEHLGMLDTVRYFSEWQKRRAAYDAAGLADQLVTTDDLNGVDETKLRAVVSDLFAGKLKGKADSRFSSHHYQLWD